MPISSVLFVDNKQLLEIYRHFLNIGIWNIEVYFKACKQYLKYTKECQSTSFDSLTAHLVIANVRYMMLSVFQRANTDRRRLENCSICMPRR